MTRFTTFAIAASVLLASCGGENAPPAETSAEAPASSGSTSAATEAKKQNAGVVNVYSARHYDSDLALYKQFTEETGIKVNLLEGESDQLIQRMVNEAEFSPADVLITVDAGRLWRGVDRGVFQPLEDQSILNRIPEHFKNPDNYWVALTKRARVIVYNKEDGAPEGLTEYADLADPAYEGEICMRTSTNIYNLSLIASFVSRQGEEGAEEWARGVVSNFARSPQGNDISILKSIAAGECGLTVANTYYIARLGVSENEADREVYNKLGIIFPNQQTTGTHVNVSGIGLAKYTKNKENALALIEFLTRPDIQHEFSSGNNEYPAVPDAETAPQVVALGDFVADDLNVSELGRNQAAAVRVLDRAGWN